MLFFGKASTTKSKSYCVTSEYILVSPLWTCGNTYFIITIYKNNPDAKKKERIKKLLFKKYKLNGLFYHDDKTFF